MIINFGGNSHHHDLYISGGSPANFKKHLGQNNHNMNPKNGLAKKLLGFRRNDPSNMKEML